jgi:hypothetical protein
MASPTNSTERRFASAVLSAIRAWALTAASRNASISREIPAAALI